MKSYSPTFRARALALAEKEGPERAAKKLKVSPQSIYHWRKSVPSSNSFIQYLDKTIARLNEEVSMLKKTRDTLNSCEALLPQHL